MKNLRDDPPPYKLGKRLILGIKGTWIYKQFINDVDVQVHNMICNMSTKVYEQYVKDMKNVKVL